MRTPSYLRAADSRPAAGDRAVSHPLGVILLVVVTILLALLVLLMVDLRLFVPGMGVVPQIFVITAIESVDEITGIPSLDSRVILLHTGESVYQNRDLRADFFRNGLPVRCSIATMNGHDFISTHHYGVQWMGGSGCSGATWTPGERICIDFTDGTFLPGDLVRVEIIDKKQDAVISRHSFRHG